MARSLKNKPNTVAPDSDFPYGRIRDNNGTGNGTPVNELVYGDIHQFFEKLMNAAGVTPNELPDNEYTGFQLFEALTLLFNDASIAWRNDNLTLGSGFSNTSFQYKKVNRGVVKLRGILTKSGGINAGDVGVTLPVGFRPPSIMTFVCHSFSFLEGNHVAVVISTDGDISFYQPGISGGNPLDGSSVNLDGIEFEPA